MPETINYVDEDDEDDVDLSFTVEELKEFNDCLYDLVPFLETTQIDTLDESTGVQSQMLSTSQISELSSSATLPNLRIEAQSYQRNILDKFPNANLELVGTMAELNWLRHERIRDLSNKDADTEALDSSTNAFEHTPTKSEVDTSTIPTSFQPSSTFSKAQSCSSIGTSLYEPSQSNIASTGHVRFPNPPLRFRSGKSFVCTICFQPLKNIHSKGQWRYVNSVVISRTSISTSNQCHIEPMSSKTSNLTIALLCHAQQRMKLLALEGRGSTTNLKITDSSSNGYASRTAGKFSTKRNFLQPTFKTTICPERLEHWPPRNWKRPSPAVNKDVYHQSQA